MTPPFSYALFENKDFAQFLLILIQQIGIDISR